MDEQRFDQLSRRFAVFRTRRQAIRAIAGAAVVTVAGVKGTAAQSCTAHYSPCGGDADCCGGAVCEYGLCMPGCRVDGAFIHALISPPENICGQCQPSVSTTSLVPVNDGMACWSGDLNAGFTTCQQGVCAPYCLSDAECDEGTICCSGSCVAADTLDHCGGCGNVCSAPEHAAAFCGEAGCDYTCDTGYEPDGTGGCVCASAALVGPGGGVFCVDDGIHVYVNGNLVLEHTGTTRCFFDPVPLGAVSDGDEIHVVAHNSPDTCGDISIDPLYLICQDTDVLQTLDAVGYPGGTQDDCGAVFYDRTFFVDL